MDETKDKVTRETLRTMRAGERRVFVVADAAAIESARSTCAITGKLEGCRFACSADYRQNVVTIERQAIP